MADPALGPLLGAKRALLVVAAPLEARAVLSGVGGDAGLASRTWAVIEANDRLDLVVAGVGKAAAAGATGRLLDPDRHALALSLGVCGALPGGGLEVGQVVAATRCVFADEGLETPEGFTDVAAMGFPPGPEGGMGVAADEPVVAALGALSDATGVIATVSTCAGTDRLAETVRARTGAVAEAMEGAAAGVTARRVSGAVAFGEWRVVSNTTGDRAAQRWDLRGALERLSEIASRL